MRNLILFGALVSTACSFKFLENAQTYLSGNADASVSAGSSGSNFLSGLQNSSFGQAVMGGINTYNQAKNSSGGNWQTAVANSSVGNFFQNGIDFFNGMKNGTQNFLDTDTIQETIGNSSFGEVVQTGVEFFNNIKNGNSPFQGDASSVMSQFVPFLANASAEAKAEFYTILPNFGNMTIAEFETAVNAWAAKYNLTDEVEAFNERSKNATVVAEEHANVVVMNLPNVLNNLKAISSDKNQTVVEMHTRMMAYVNSLDDDTRDIVFIFFRNLLPPQFKKSKCVDQGNFLTNMYNKASDFFAGRNNRTDGEGSFWSGQGQNGNSGGSGFSSFFNNFNGQGNGNGNGAQNPMIGMFNNFMKKNNITADEANAAMADGGASIQILPAISAGWGDVAQVKIGGDFKIAVEEETKTTKKNKKQQQQANKNKNKNKKKTTIAPEAAIDANIAAEVHTQVL